MTTTPPSANRQVIVTDKAPKALGPYSQGIKAGPYVFTAAQVAIDPATGKLVEGDIAAQTRQVLTNIAAIVEAGGSSLGQVVRTTVFLKDLNDFQAMNAVYATFFPPEHQPPARTTLEASRLPLGGLVAIDAIAATE